MNSVRLPIVTERFLTVVLKVLIHGEDITSGDVRNIKTLFDKIDYKFYMKDPTVYSLIYTLNIITELKLKKIDDVSIIMTKIESILSSQYKDVIDGVIVPIIMTEQSVTTEETNYILKAVSQYLKNIYLMEEKDRVIDLFMGLSSGAVYNVEETIGELKDVITKLHRNLMMSETSSFDKTSIIHTTDTEFFDKYLSYAFNVSKNPQSVLRLGIKMLNEMLSKEGGLLAGKMYVINAPTNSFKTTMMMYIALWIQRYNSEAYRENYEKTGIRPTVLFVSLENTWDENVARFFSMSTGRDFSMCENFEEAKDLWQKFFSPEGTIIDISMVYAKANKFSPADLEQHIEDLQSEGYVVINVIVDYMKIMRSDIGNKDKRQDLIQVSTDLHELGARYGSFSLLTAHHTNRDGDKNITDMEAKGIVNKVRQMGREHLTEAHSVEEPIDYSMYILPEKSPFDGELYITFKRGKCRYGRTDREGFVHKLTNGFLIQDDVELPEGQYLSKDMITDERTQDLSFKASTEKIGRRGIANLMEIPEDNGTLIPEEKPVMVVSASNIFEQMEKKALYERLAKEVGVYADDTNDFVYDAKPSGETLVTDSGLRFAM